MNKTIYAVQEFVAGKWFTVRAYDTEAEAREHLGHFGGYKRRILRNGKKI